MVGGPCQLEVKAGGAGWERVEALAGLEWASLETDSCSEVRARGWPCGEDPGEVKGKRGQGGG